MLPDPADGDLLEHVPARLPASGGAAFDMERQASRAHAAHPNRMSTIVEMFRAAAAPKGRDRFACQESVWELLLELGHAFGWHPQGTTYVVPANTAVDAPARRNYQPGDSRDHKRIAEEDALSWARALELAKVSPHAAAMIQARSVALAGSGKSAGELLPGELDEFIEFAYGGAFEFAIRNEVGGGVTP